MLLDTSIPLSVQTPQFNPAQGQMQALQMRDMLDSGKLRQLQMQKAQTELDKQTALTELAKSSGGDINAYQQGLSEIDPLAGMKLKRDNQQYDLNTKIGKLEAANAEIDLIAKFLPNVTDQVTYTNAKESLARSGVDVSQIPDQYDPKYVENAKMWSLDTADKIKIALDQEKLEETKRMNAATLNNQNFDNSMKANEFLMNKEKFEFEKNKIENPPAPAGFRKTADGNLEPIPGGAFDPETITKKKAAEEKGKNIAKIDPVKVEQEAKYMLDLLDSITTTDAQGNVINHKGLSAVVGIPNPFTKWTPGTEAANFKVKLDQIQGKQFMQAYETLKGGGQITEVEGRKATDAMARMNTAQSEEEFIKGVNEFKQVVRDVAMRSKAKASGLNINDNITSDLANSGIKFVGFE